MKILHRLEDRLLRWLQAREAERLLKFSERSGIPPERIYKGIHELPILGGRRGGRTRLKGQPLDDNGGVRFEVTHHGDPPTINLDPPIIEPRRSTELRDITVDEWNRYEWVEGTTHDSPSPVFLRAQAITEPPDDGFKYIRVGPSWKWRWVRARTYREEKEQSNAVV